MNRWMIWRSVGRNMVFVEDKHPTYPFEIVVSWAQMYSNNYGVVSNTYIKRTLCRLCVYIVKTKIKICRPESLARNLGTLEVAITLRQRRYWCNCLPLDLGWSRAVPIATSSLNNGLKVRRKPTAQLDETSLQQQEFFSTDSGYYWPCTEHFEVW